jgi:hypothetical protein
VYQRLSKRPPRLFSVYDFEWAPPPLVKATPESKPSGNFLESNMRLCGVYDGRRYISYRSIAEFIDGQLTPSNHGRWFFAHFGGLSDFQFILEKIRENPRYSVELIFSGSSVIIAKVRDKHSRHFWSFLDSGWLFKVPLSEIGKWIGIQKTGPEEGMTEDQKIEWFRSVPLDELEEYNEVDCRILWHAIAQFELELLGLGGELRMTAASCSLDLFLRKYLKREILVNDVVNRWARQAYIASRVEIISKHAKAFDYYDINSSFPYSGTFPLPGNVIRMTSNKPDHGIYLTEAEIQVPESMIPPLPYRHSSKIYFPVGKWRSYFFNIDLEYLEECGGKILNTWDSVIFEPFDDCAEFFETIYKLRGEAQGFRKEVFKIVANSLYGKFAENPEKQTVYVNPSLETMERLDLVSCRGDPPVGRAKMWSPGVFVETKRRPIDHSHVSISAAITAYSRKWLTQYMREANEVYYCDTDGLAVDPDTVFPVGKKLGDLKLETQVRDNPENDSPEFVRPKVYRYTDTEGKTHCKAKGFSLRTKKGIAGDIAIKQFQELMDGRDLSIRRMHRIKENLANGIVQPWESLVSKRLSPNEQPKRYFFRDGTSRPYTIKEINAEK